MLWEVWPGELHNRESTSSILEQHKLTSNWSQTTVKHDKTIQTTYIQHNVEWVWKIKQGCFCYMVYWYLKKKCQKIMHIVLTVRISCQNFCPLGRIDAYQGVLGGTLFYILWQRMRHESHICSAALEFTFLFAVFLFLFCFCFMGQRMQIPHQLSLPS